MQQAHRQVRCREELVEIVQRQLERCGPQWKKLSPELLDAGVVCEQRFLEAGQIVGPNIHARPALLRRRAEPARAALPIDRELGDEIWFGVRDDVDIAMLITVFGAGLIARFEATRIKIGNLLLDLDRQSVKPPRLREDTIDELLRDAMALQIEKSNCPADVSQLSGSSFAAARPALQ